MMVQNTGEGFSMDEVIKQARSKKNLPYWYTVSVEPANEPPNEKFWWYDAYAGYVVFDTGREMAEYVFDKFQIPKDLQNRLFAEFNGKEWRMSDVGMVPTCYYDLGYSYDRVIEVVNAMQRGL